jgi:hypothetical protein
MRLLPFRIGMSNQGARFAQPKAPLPEQALTLAHPQADLEALLDPGTQRLPIPQRAIQAKVTRGLAEHPVVSKYWILSKAQQDSESADGGYARVMTR